MKRKSKKKWYAVYTKSRQEEKVFDRFCGQNIEAFLPKVEVVRVYSDRRKKVSEVLFKSYVFVRITEKDYEQVFQTTGVVGFVRFEGKPAAIPDIQIEAIKKFIRSDDLELVSKEDFALGQEVEIIKGPFRGQSGKLIQQNNKNVVVIEIEVVNSYIPIHIHKAFLKKIE